MSKKSKAKARTSKIVLDTEAVTCNVAITSDEVGRKARIFVRGDVTVQTEKPRTGKKHSADAGEHGGDFAEVLEKLAVLFLESRKAEATARAHRSPMHTDRDTGPNGQTDEDHDEDHAS